ncbi:SNF2-related protein [Patescibacteria group bacterium]
MFDFSKDNLIGNLIKFAGEKVFDRGDEYHRSRLVGKIKISSFGVNSKVLVSALVFGSEIYEPEFIFDFKTNNFSKVNCDCPYDSGDCKHVVALGLKFVDFLEEFFNSTPEYENFSGNIRDYFVRWSKDTLSNLSKEHWEDDERYEPLEYNRNDSLEEEVVVDYDESYTDSSSHDGEEDTRPFEERFHLILNSMHGFANMEVRANSSHTYYWVENLEHVLKKEKNSMNQDQKKLLKFLRDSDKWSADYDWGEVFLLIHESKMEFFLDKRASDKRLELNLDTKEKLKVELVLENKSSHLHDNESGLENISFSFTEDSIEDAKNIFPGKKYMAVLENNILNFHKTDKSLQGIIYRIRNDINEIDYHNIHIQESKKYSTNLSSEEIIEINKIIKQSKKCFDLKTELVPNFKAEVFPEPKPVIAIDCDWKKNSLYVKAMMDYGFEKVDVATLVKRRASRGRVSFIRNDIEGREVYWMKIGDGKIYYSPRNHKEELAMFMKFSKDEKYGFSKTVTCKRRGAKQLKDYAKSNWPHLKRSGYPVLIEKDPLDVYTEDFSANFEIDLESANDWLSFDVDCYCGENKINLEDLKRCISDKDDFVKTKDGRMIKISNRKELEDFILMLESFYQKESQKFEGKIYHAPELEDIFTSSKYYNAKISKSFSNFMKESQNGKPVEKIAINSKAEKTLRSYQKEGIDWFYFLRKYRFGGILADDMGLGKTLQSLVLVDMNNVDKKPSLVVCPKTLLFNWEDEALKFFPKMKTLLIDGNPKERKEKMEQVDEYDLIITSYSSIKKDKEIYKKMNLKFNYCILDEAQFIKNHKTQNSRAVKEINADYRLALTGTPLENNVSEIWSIFDFLMPGFLGSYNAFNRKFLRPIMKHSDADALKKLRKKVTCFMLRRTKSNVLKELPLKIEQINHCRLGDHQNILYQEVLASVKSKIFETVERKGFNKSQIHILAGLTKLRQICNHPVLLLKDADYSKYPSAKLDIFLELVTEIASANRKVLVFSQFTSMLDVLGSELEKNKIKYSYLSGKTKNRKELVTEFNEDPEISVFLISLKAGGTGLNLTSADNVIIFDPWWNLSVENQAIDRAHRIGQKNSVNVHRLITKGTIEEKIVKLQEKKQFLFDNMVGETNDLFKKLTWEDVKEIFE